MFDSLLFLLLLKGCLLLRTNSLLLGPLRVELPLDDLAEGFDVERQKHVEGVLLDLIGQGVELVAAELLEVGGEGTELVVELCLLVP